MLRAVLFDMDGVIVDTEPLHRKAYHQMFNEVSIDVKEDLYASFTGQSTINICKRLVDHFSLSETPEYLVSLKRKHYNSIFENDDLQLIDAPARLNHHIPNCPPCRLRLNPQCRQTPHRCKPVRHAPAG